jgi:hypothetical protein
MALLRRSVEYSAEIATTPLPGAFAAIVYCPITIRRGFFIFRAPKPRTPLLRGLMQGNFGNL